MLENSQNYRAKIHISIISVVFLDYGYKNKFYFKQLSGRICNKILDKMYRVRYNSGEVKILDNKYEALRLKNQLCFPLYAVSNLITRRYKPLLDELDLTYTQYIVMMVLWEEEKVNEKFLCEALHLKSNTVAPLLKKLEAKGYIKKRKDEGDERNLIITLTQAGRELKEKAVCVPESIAKEVSLSGEEAAFLYKILYKILDSDRENKG